VGCVRQFESAPNSGRNQDHKTKKGRAPEFKQESNTRRPRGAGPDRAGESARRTARMHGTPIYVWENGKVVAKEP